MTRGEVAARLATRTVDWPCTTEEVRITLTCLHPAQDA